MTLRSHLFSYRTQKLSSAVQKVLGWTRPGRICRCRFPKIKTIQTYGLYFCAPAPTQLVPGRVQHVPGRHEALSQQFGELLVARVNEADAFGNAEVGLCRCRFPKQKPHSKCVVFLLVNTVERPAVSDLRVLRLHVQQVRSGRVRIFLASHLN